MREIVNIRFRSHYPPTWTAVCLIILLMPALALAGQVTLTIPVDKNHPAVETGLAPLAYGSDSVYCAGELLERDTDYEINTRSGTLTFLVELSCDSVTLTAFRIPRWMMASMGNQPSTGRRFLAVGTGTEYLSRPTGISPQKITLTGNKSFSFNVGRSGEGRFSQGLNVDFDARFSDDLRLRGSVSDRGGAEDQYLAGEGGTVILSELDKYFFEIDGKRLKARGGDISAVENRYLPIKRMKGIGAAYNDQKLGVAVDLGRPAGRFVSQRLNGIDGRQGPYQAVGDDGTPSGIVPGSEKVYVDGRLLEGGADKHYTVDYPSGRITFMPRVLITSRSRIEIDFEAAMSSYEQVVYDAATEMKLWDGKMTLNVGGRRETDEKDRLRFGALSANEIDRLRTAGDVASLAYTSGVNSDTAGDYRLVTDTAGVEYYQYVGDGAGEYSVSFSAVGEGRGDYRYLGDGVYEYAGKGSGDYMPIRFLPLPTRNDFFYGAMQLRPYTGGLWSIEYQGNNRDDNLFSPLDDGDNFRGRLAGQIAHQSGPLASTAAVRFRQAGYNPTYRVDPPDDNRLWGLPSINPAADELRLYFDNNYQTLNNQFTADFGYLGYKDSRRSYRTVLAGQLLNDKNISPRLSYRNAVSSSLDSTEAEGLYERYGAGLAVKFLKPLRLDFDYDRELAENKYDTIPDIEKYRQYRATAFIRKSTLAVSRRIEYQSAFLGYRGPQQDKVELTSEESFGRLQVALAGTWFEQKRLDSHREDRVERLYATTFRYAPGSAWVTLQADYRQNRQNVRATGYRYILVTSGEGDYRYEDGQYLYDPEGDYIRIREERGDAVSVSTGEKSHNITLYPGRMPAMKRYQAILSQIAFRLRTEVVEEMPNGLSMELSWIIPWTSRSGIEYIRRTRRENYQWLLFPRFNFYILNFSYGNNFEEQDAGALLYRNDRAYEAEVKNRLAPAVLTRLAWRHRRNHESGAGTIAVDLRGDTYSGGFVINPNRLQLTPGVSYLRFRDARSGGKGEGVVFSAETIWRRPEKGEVRFVSELRSLTEKIPFSQPEYLVTDGRRFGQSALFNLIVNYEIGKTWRVNVNLTDRIYEGRPAEFVGRGELLARF